MTEALTTAQAAFVVGTPLDVFKRTVDKAPVKWRVALRHGRKERQFHFVDLVFLHAYGDLKQEFTPKGQTAFYRALCKERVDAHAQDRTFSSQGCEPLNLSPMRRSPMAM
jgi:AraC-like DNA-binding protein